VIVCLCVREKVCERVRKEKASMRVCKRETERRRERKRERERKCVCVCVCVCGAWMRWNNAGKCVGVLLRHVLQTWVAMFCSVLQWFVISWICVLMHHVLQTYVADR